MKKSYYLFNAGRMSRRDNTLKFVAVDAEGKEEKPRYLPVEGVKSFYVFGSLDANSSTYNFLAKNNITVHFFDYYEHYTGSFMPKDYLLAGKMQIAQTQFYSNKKKRLAIAQAFIDGAQANMLKNLSYYNKRGKDVANEIALIETFAENIKQAADIPALMGTEGNIRQSYYQAFDIIINDFDMQGRSKQPPKNEVNALVSFGNMMCYTACLDAIYHTQLNPTISFLHEPGFRRYSLALDLAEIFKPLLVDRTIFKVLNKRMIGPKGFDKKVNSCLLNKGGRKTFVKAYEERLRETIKHRTLNKSVSYKHLIKLECYKLCKHLLNIETYRPFKMWW